MTEETLYLIAHKVRGQPAFDIAIQMEVEGEDEPWWILPSTGHRAYPYWSYKLQDLFTYSNVGLPPADWPDFYRQPSVRVKDPAPDRKALDLLTAIGLIPSTPINRRI